MQKKKYNPSGEVGRFFFIKPLPSSSTSFRPWTLASTFQLFSRERVWLSFCSPRQSISSLQATCGPCCSSWCSSHWASTLSSEPSRGSCNAPSISSFFPTSGRRFSQISVAYTNKNPVGVANTVVYFLRSKKLLHYNYMVFFSSNFPWLVTDVPTIGLDVWRVSETFLRFEFSVEFDIVLDTVAEVCIPELESWQGQHKHTFFSHPLIFLTLRLLLSVSLEKNGKSNWSILGGMGVE